MAEASIPGGGRAAWATRSAGAQASPWIERLARIGYAAKGAVYILVGGLAVAAAVGSGGRASGSSGAMASISDATLGRVVLGAIALGLVGYVVWQGVRAAFDPEEDGVGRRLLYALFALIHAGLASQAAQLAIHGGGSGSGSGGGGGSGGAQHWSARMMQQPFGPWLLGAAGVAVGLYGLQQIWNAWRVDLDDQLDLRSMTRRGRTWAIRSGRFGLAARGLVFAIVGTYLVVAAAQSDPSEAKGLGGVLEMMAGTPWLLGLVAAGLVAYGVYYLVRARYRIIQTP